MAFPPSLLDEIRARVPVSEVVGRRVQWDRRKTQAARGDYWACCPFHNEKTPSFHADDRKGRYHCFGCGVGGDIFTFLTETEGMPFPEAVEMLAREAGLEVPRADPREAAREERRAGLHEVMEAAARFFEQSLASGAGRVARDYLDQRGLSAEAISRFRLGYAPNARHALKEHLASAGVTTAAMVEAGLLIAGDDIAVPFDRFRDRVIFPIPDSRGQIIAFGGRALSPDAQAKYLNSPETPLFSKRAVLYNYAAARKPAQDRGQVIVAEGYMDVIALAMAGFENAVAPLGTALTERQLQLVWRLAPEPVLCFDGDAAGQRAALRVAETALPDLKPGKSLRFAFLPEGQDPDDLVRRSGGDGIQRILDDASTLPDVLWNTLKDSQDINDPSHLAKIDFDIDLTVKKIGDGKVRFYYTKFLRKKLGSAQFAGKFKRSSNFGSELNKLHKSNIDNNSLSMKSGYRRRYEIIKCLLLNLDLIDEFEEVLQNINIEDGVLSEIFKSIMIARGALLLDGDDLGREFYNAFIHNIGKEKTIKVLLKMFCVDNIESLSVTIGSGKDSKLRESIVGNILYMHQIEGLGDELYDIENEIKRGNFELAMDRIYAMAKEFAGNPNRDFMIFDMLGKKYVEENIPDSKSAKYKRMKAEQLGRERPVRTVA